MLGSERSLLRIEALTMLEVILVVTALIMQD